MIVSNTCVHLRDGSKIVIQHVKPHKTLEGFELQEHYVIRFGENEDSNVTLFFPPDMYQAFAQKIFGVIAGTVKEEI
jgi:hypothetical protein